MNIEQGNRAVAYADGTLDRREIATELRRLASLAEQAGAAEQARCLSAGVGPLCDGLAAVGEAPSDETRELATRHLLAGAFESAILALVPATATVTGGRIGTQTVIGQVLLADQAGRHSRRAQTLALAWLTAFAMSLADLLEPEMRS